MNGHGREPRHTCEEENTLLLPYQRRRDVVKWALGMVRAAPPYRPRFIRMILYLSQEVRVLGRLRRPLRPFAWRYPTHLDVPLHEPFPPSSQPACSFSPSVQRLTMLEPLTCTRTMYRQLE